MYLKPCPLGFSLQERCSLDPVLVSYHGISITFYNVDDGTIDCPANSFISADIVNGSNVFHVSPRCPFDYCLPHPTNFNLIHSVSLLEVVYCVDNAEEVSAACLAHLNVNVTQMSMCLSLCQLLLQVL